MSYPVCPQCGFASLFKLCSQCGTHADRPPTAPRTEDLMPHRGQFVAVDWDGTVIGADDILGDLIESLGRRKPAAILTVPENLDVLTIEPETP